MCQFCQWLPCWLCCLLSVSKLEVHRNTNTQEGQGQLPCLPHRTPEGGPWTGNRIVQSVNPQKVLPVSWYGSPPNHTSPYTLSTPGSCCSFQGVILVKYPKQGPHVTHCAAEKRYMGWIPAGHIHQMSWHLLASSSEWWQLRQELHRKHQGL